MMYGPGIPIMYVISMIYFVVAYWSDKILILYFHRKPLFFDELLSLEISWWFKIGLLLHLVAGILMFSNSKILPVDTFNAPVLDESIGSQIEG